MTYIVPALRRRWHRAAPLTNALNSPYYWHSGGPYGRYDKLTLRTQSAPKHIAQLSDSGRRPALLDSSCLFIRTRSPRHQPFGLPITRATTSQRSWRRARHVNQTPPRPHGQCTGYPYVFCFPFTHPRAGRTCLPSLASTELTYASLPSRSGSWSSSPSSRACCFTLSTIPSSRTLCR